jgi:hypothetical protein
VTVEKFARIARKKNTVFVDSVKSITEKKEKVVKDMAKLLKEYKDMFSVKSPPDLSLERGEDDYTISIVPGVRPQARNLYRLMLEEREVLKTCLKKLMETRHIRLSSSF